MPAVAIEKCCVFVSCARQLKPRRLIYDLTWTWAERHVARVVQSTSNVCFSYYSCFTQGRNSVNQDKEIMCNAFEGVTASKTIDFVPWTAMTWFKRFLNGTWDGVKTREISSKTGNSPVLVFTHFLQFDYAVVLVFISLFTCG